MSRVASAPPPAPRALEPLAIPRTGPARVAHILPWPAIGGIEIATLRVAQGVHAAGFESIAYCPEAEGPVAELFSGHGFQTCGYRRQEPSVRRPLPYLQNSVRLARHFRRERIDLVHCSDLLGAHYAGLAARLARIPVLSHIRSRYTDVPARDRASLQLIDHFAFVSRDSWDQFGYRVAESRGTVIYDGLELDACAEEVMHRDRREIREEFGIPEGASLVGMVARIAPAKDYPTLVAAAQRLVTEVPGVHLLLVGDHSSSEAYRSHHAEIRGRIEAAGLAGQVIFTDFRRDIDRFLRALDLFVLSTHLEGLPLVILEAMAQGRAVVATAVGGVPEVVAHGETGFLVPPGDAAALAESIGVLLRDPERRRAMGAAGRERLRSHFSQESFERAMQKLYTRMLSRARR